jgi:hypothetical protein
MLSPQKKIENIIRYETHTDGAIEEQSGGAIALSPPHAQGEKSERSNGKGEKAGKIRSVHGLLFLWQNKGKGGDGSCSAALPMCGARAISGSSAAASYPK